MIATLEKFICQLQKKMEKLVDMRMELQTRYYEDDVHVVGSYTWLVLTEFNDFHMSALAKRFNDFKLCYT